MDIEDAIYDGSATAMITGLTGLFRGAKATIRLGQCLVVGRSRVCAVSVARAEECLQLTKVALEAHKSYRKISRQHFRVCLTGEDRIEIEDLSTNGTVVNGFKIDRLVIEHFASDAKKIMIEFGHGEVMELIATGATVEQSSEALTSQKAMPTFDQEEHLSGVDGSSSGVVRPS